MEENTTHSAHDEATGIVREAGEGGGVTEEVSWELTKPGGLVVKGPAPGEWDFRDEMLANEREDTLRSLTVPQLQEIAGQRGLELPAKARKDDLVGIILADDLKRPPDDGLPLGYVDENMKGPGPQWERDEDGNLLRLSAGEEE